MTAKKTPKNEDNRKTPEMEPAAEMSLDEAKDAAKDSPMETPSVKVGDTRKDGINMTFDEVSESEDPNRDVTPVPREMDDERSGYVVTKVPSSGNMAKPEEMPGNEEVDLEARIQNRDNYYEDADITPDNDRKDK